MSYYLKINRKTSYEAELYHVDLELQRYETPELAMLYSDPYQDTDDLAPGWDTAVIFGPFATAEDNQEAFRRFDEETLPSGEACDPFDHSTYEDLIVKEDK